MDFLNIKDKTFLITGASNKKSIATFIAHTLLRQGARPVFLVQSEAHMQRMERIFPDSPFYICDVENEKAFNYFSEKIMADNHVLSGMIHAIAFANYQTPVPFMKTRTDDFLQAFNISCLSFIRLCNLPRAVFTDNASMVTFSISTTKSAAYGYLGPVKAALESTVAYLAQSFAKSSQIRVNAICAGPLKTAAAAGIPGFMNNYLYSEKLSLRKSALQTQEVANTAAFLLSERSSGINATNVLVDAGMSVNTFDEQIVRSCLD
ncbi:MAG: SDR family oxidoreductase [Halobacteriovoraceae bacterium]|nr:SDR family oxidoreductase [Halobacteriovoraceae bacterium]